MEDIRIVTLRNMGEKDDTSGGGFKAWGGKVHSARSQGLRKGAVTGLLEK